MKQWLSYILYRIGFWALDAADWLDPEGRGEHWEAVSDEGCSQYQGTAESHAKACADFMYENGENMEAAIAILTGKATSPTPHD